MDGRKASIAVARFPNAARWSTTSHRVDRNAVPSDPRSAGRSIPHSSQREWEVIYTPAPMTLRSLSACASILLVLSLPACDRGGSGKPQPHETAHSAKPATTTAPTATAAATAAPTTTAQAAANAAVAKMIDGAKLKPFFPPTGMDGATDKAERPPKEGMMEIAYKKGKDDVAVIVITDTAGEPRVKDDYAGVKDTAGGYPLKTSGYFKSAILVADRFQVQITSQRLKADQRKAWLEKMDLKGLAALK